MIKPFNDIVIVGTGKVAHHLGNHLMKGGKVISGVWGRDSSKSEGFANKLNTKALSSLNELNENTLAIICVSDTAIGEVVSQIPDNTKIAYTSGSIKLEDLPKKPFLGVFYPLQSFSLDKEVNMSEVPFLIEAENKDFEDELMNLASTLSSNVLKANSQERYYIHISAVMVNNFTNYLYLLANEHLEEHNLDFNILIPLIKETVDKLETLKPREAQTGPAVRGDKKVIDQHIQTISRAETKELYKIFSKLITKEFKKDEL